MKKNVHPAIFIATIVIAIGIIFALGWKATHRPSPFDKLPGPPAGAKGP